MYYWIIFGIGCYLGQFLPLSWRQPLSFGLLIIILATLVFERAETVRFNYFTYLRCSNWLIVIRNVYHVFTKFRT